VRLPAWRAPKRPTPVVPAHQDYQAAFLEDHHPLSYDTTTLDTIERIDVLWLDGRSIARAFEVEHTTAVYSGLLRMADLLALIPNKSDNALSDPTGEPRRRRPVLETFAVARTLGIGRGQKTDSAHSIPYASQIKSEAAI
jgi:hypothetical protein